MLVRFIAHSLAEILAQRALLAWYRFEESRWGYLARLALAVVITATAIAAILLNLPALAGNLQRCIEVLPWRP